MIYAHRPHRCTIGGCAFPREGATATHLEVRQHAHQEHGVRFAMACRWECRQLVPYVERMAGREPRPGEVELTVFKKNGSAVTLPLSIGLIHRVDEIDEERCRVFLTEYASWTVVGGADTVREAIAAAQAARDLARKED